MTIRPLDASDVVADLRPVAQLRTSPQDLFIRSGLAFASFDDELGPGSDAFVTDGHSVFRLCWHELDPRGPQITVLATPGHTLAQVLSLLEALGLGDDAVAGLFNGEQWLTLAEATHAA